MIKIIKPIGVERAELYFWDELPGRLRSLVCPTKTVERNSLNRL